MKLLVLQPLIYIGPLFLPLGKGKGKERDCQQMHEKLQFTGLVPIEY
jgi:hypothetical protein